MKLTSLRGRRVLVTGGAGFIGSHLVDRLLELGADVRVLDNLSTGNRANLEPSREHIEFLKGDIRDLEVCRTACRDQSIIFHQAALGSVPRSMEDPATSMAVNVLGTVNVLSAAREEGVERSVFASSSSVYGDSEVLPKREGTEGSPLSPYALSKKMCEEVADQFWRTYDMEIVGLRYFNVFGARQSPEGPYAAVIPRFFAALLQGEAPVIFGDGQQSRDFTPVAAAVEANLLAAVASAPLHGQAVNVATGRRTTVNDLAREISELVGVSQALEYQPPRPGDVRHSHADLSRALELLSYQPKTSLTEGLRDCLPFYRNLFCDKIDRSSQEIA